jgi:hypothetical protein
LETSLERIWGQSCKNAVEGVVRGYSIGQFEKGPQPGFLGTAKVSYIHPCFSPANHGTDGNRENVLQFMRLCAIYPRIGQTAEVFPDRRSHRQPPKRALFSVPSIAHPAEIIGYVLLLPSVKMRLPWAIAGLGLRDVVDMVL